MGILLHEEHIVKVDSKGKIKIPHDFILDSKEEVAFVDFDKAYYNIYPLKKLEEFITILEKQKNEGLSLEEYKKIRLQIRKVYSMIFDTYFLDDDRKLLLPGRIRESITGKQVLLQGINSHISLCPNQKSYDELCLDYLPENYGTKKL